MNISKILNSLRPVSIIRLLSEGTIEEGMYEIAQEKLHLEQQITGNEGKKVHVLF